MPPTALAYLYTDRASIEREMSEAGVRLRLSDDGDAQATAADEDVLNDCIVMATETVNYHLFHRYSPRYLAASNLVWRWATVLAAYELAARDGSPVPESLAERAQRAEEKLEAAAESRRGLPGVPLRNVPVSWSNVRCDPRYQFRVIRVERGTSARPTTPGAPGPQAGPDWRDLGTYEI